MSSLLFDEPYYIEINQARWSLAQRVIGDLARQIPGGLRTCVDVGCGPGWFSERLSGLGLDVVGVDGRPELVAEAERRVPRATFRQANVESPVEMGTLGTVDLVFCFGLLYHTENPFAVIRNLERLTGKALLLETLILPDEDAILRLVGENQNDTQGLTFNAIVPSQAALVRMTQAAGFTWVAAHVGRVEHADFLDSPTRYRRRGIYLAARQPLDVAEFRALPPARAPKYSFCKPDLS